MSGHALDSAALDQLCGARAKFLGAVLNRVNVARNAYYYSHYYRHAYTDYYAPEHERSIAWDDDAIGIDWPLAAHGIDAPLLSDKDRAALPLSEAECFE